MVNSGSYKDRNEKAALTQPQAIAIPDDPSSPVTTPAVAQCKADSKGTADVVLPSASVAIEPKMSTDNTADAALALENVSVKAEDDDEDKSVCCSVPLDRVQGVLTTYQPATKVVGSEGDAESKMKQNPSRKLLCLYCDRTFVSANLRQKHVERCHSAKQNRRVSPRQMLTVTPCVHCDKLNNTEHTLKDLFQHLTSEHSNKYYACSPCEERFLSPAQLTEHNASSHPKVVVSSPETSSNSKVMPKIEEPPEEIPQKITRSRLKLSDTPTHSTQKTKRIMAGGKKSSKFKDLRNKKFAVKTSRIALKRSKRLQAKLPPETTKIKRSRPTDRKPNTSKTTENPSSIKSVDKSGKPNSNCVNPYPEFDSFFRVKKITDHSIDNLKISSLTFDDVFDKAFFNRIKCNIQENLLHHIDGKLFKNEESESRISNFEKTPHLQQEVQNSSSENYGCELSLNAVTPAASLSLNSQFGEDFESQIEYGSKPSKKKNQTKSKDEVHYKYFTRRKYQASILEHKENRDLSKLDMWTQLVIKNRQQQIVDDKKSAKEILEYTNGDEFKNKTRKEELNRILDRRGPFEDLREEATKQAALDKFNSNSSENISQETFSEVREVLNELLNKVYSMCEKGVCAKEEADISCSANSDTEIREIPSYLNLRRASSLPVEGDIDRSDKIALICSSQETENFELPTNSVREKDELVELTGEWARTRMYICAACGKKVLNMKHLLEHKSAYHQNVWVQHYEFVGNQSELYRHLSIPGLGKVGFLEDGVQCKLWKRSDARVCTKCGKQCNALAELHRHILECGGDWTWMLARKKCKYRPFGAKSRRKRRGLVKRHYHPNKTDRPTEKKTYKKPFDGPRQRPSDADTIQRMLANLPAKRSTRKIMCLQDGYRSRKNRDSTNSTQNKIKCGKLIYKNVKSNEVKNISSPKNIKNTKRNFNTVLSSRIIDSNSTLRTKRILKNLANRRVTRQTKELTEEVVATVTEKPLEKESDGDQISPKRKKNNKNKENLDENKDSTETVKRVSPRKEKSLSPQQVKKKLTVKKILTGKINIKSFFPVKKKKKVAKIESDNTPDSTEINTRNKRRSKEIKEEGEGVSECEPDSTMTVPEETSSKVEKKMTKKGIVNALVRTLSIKRKKKTVASLENISSDNVIEEKDTPEEPEEKTETEEVKSSKKRKFKRSFRKVVKKVKKLKVENTSEADRQMDSPLENNKLQPLNQPNSFLEVPFQMGTSLEKIVAPSILEKNENIVDNTTAVPTAISCIENLLVPETMFNLETSNEKSLQAKGELNFDSVIPDVINSITPTKCDIIEGTLTAVEPQNKKEIKSKDVPDIIASKDIEKCLPALIIPPFADKTGPISIETSSKCSNSPLSSPLNSLISPSSGSMISPSLSRKIRKPGKGLNDCIAMLTSKLQQKTDTHADLKQTNSEENLVMAKEPITKTELKITEKPIVPKLFDKPVVQKSECILKIPTFKSGMQEPMDQALDLTTKSCENLSSPISYQKKSSENVNQLINFENKSCENLMQPISFENLISRPAFSFPNLLSLHPNFLFSPDHFETHRVRALSNLDLVIESVVENRATTSRTSSTIDNVIQQVVENSCPISKSMPNISKHHEEKCSRNSVDNIIEYVIRACKQKDDIKTDLNNKKLEVIDKESRKIGCVRKRTSKKFEDKILNLENETDLPIEELNTAFLENKESIVRKQNDTLRKIGEPRRRGPKKRLKSEASKEGKDDKPYLETNVDDLFSTKEISTKTDISSSSTIVKNIVIDNSEKHVDYSIEMNELVNEDEPHLLENKMVVKETLPVIPSNSDSEDDVPLAVLIKSDNKPVNEKENVHICVNEKYLEGANSNSVTEINKKNNGTSKNAIDDTVNSKEKTFLNFSESTIESSNSMVDLKRPSILNSEKLDSSEEMTAKEESHTSINTLSEESNVKDIVKDQTNTVSNINNEVISEPIVAEQPVQKKRGRPRKNPTRIVTNTNKTNKSIDKTEELTPLEEQSILSKSTILKSINIKDSVNDVDITKTDDAIIQESPCSKDNIVSSECSAYSTTGHEEDPQGQPICKELKEKIETKSTSNDNEQPQDKTCPVTNINVFDSVIEEINIKKTVKKKGRRGRKPANKQAVIVSEDVLKNSLSSNICDLIRQTETEVHSELEHELGVNETEKADNPEKTIENTSIQSEETDMSPSVIEPIQSVKPSDEDENIPVRKLEAHIKIQIKRKGKSKNRHSSIILSDDLESKLIGGEVQNNFNSPVNENKTGEVQQSEPRRRSRKKMMSALGLKINDSHQIDKDALSMDQDVNVLNQETLDTPLKINVENSEISESKKKSKRKKSVSNITVETPNVEMQADSEAVMSRKSKVQNKIITESTATKDLLVAENSLTDKSNTKDDEIESQQVPFEESIPFNRSKSLRNSKTNINIKTTPEEEKESSNTADLAVQEDKSIFLGKDIDISKELLSEESNLNLEIDERLKKAGEPKLITKITRKKSSGKLEEYFADSNVKEITTNMFLVDESVSTSNQVEIDSNLEDYNSSEAINRDVVDSISSELVKKRKSSKVNRKKLTGKLDQNADLNINNDLTAEKSIPVLTEHVNTSTELNDLISNDTIQIQTDTSVPIPEEIITKKRRGKKSMSPVKLSNNENLTYPKTSDVEQKSDLLLEERKNEDFGINQFTLKNGRRRRGPKTVSPNKCISKGVSKESPGVCEEVISSITSETIVSTVAETNDADTNKIDTNLEDSNAFTSSITDHDMLKSVPTISVKKRRGGKSKSPTKRRSFFDNVVPSKNLNSDELSSFEATGGEMKHIQSIADNFSEKSLSNDSETTMSRKVGIKSPSKCSNDDSIDVNKSSTFNQISNEDVQLEEKENDVKDLLPIEDNITNSRLQFNSKKRRGKSFKQETKVTNNSNEIDVLSTSVATDKLDDSIRNEKDSVNEVLTESIKTISTSAELSTEASKTEDCLVESFPKIIVKKRKSSRTKSPSKLVQTLASFTDLDETEKYFVDDSNVAATTPETIKIKHTTPEKLNDESENMKVKPSGKRRRALRNKSPKKQVSSVDKISPLIESEIFSLLPVSTQLEVPESHNIIQQTTPVNLDKIEESIENSMLNLDEPLEKHEIKKLSKVKSSIKLPNMDKLDPLMFSDDKQISENLNGTFGYSITEDQLTNIEIENSPIRGRISRTSKIKANSKINKIVDLENSAKLDVDDGLFSKDINTTMENESVGDNDHDNFEHDPTNKKGFSKTKLNKTSEEAICLISNVEKVENGNLLKDISEDSSILPESISLLNPEAQLKKLPSKLIKLNKYVNSDDLNEIHVDNKVGEIMFENVSVKNVVIEKKRGRRSKKAISNSGDNVISDLDINNRETINIETSDKEDSKNICHKKDVLCDTFDSLVSTNLNPISKSRNNAKNDINESLDEDINIPVITDTAVQQEQNTRLNVIQTKLVNSDESLSDILISEVTATPTEGVSKRKPRKKKSEIDKLTAAAIILPDINLSTSDLKQPVEEITRKSRASKTKAAEKISKVSVQENSDEVSFIENLESKKTETKSKKSKTDDNVTDKYKATIKANTLPDIASLELDLKDNENIRILPKEKRKKCLKTINSLEHIDEDVTTTNHLPQDINLKKPQSEILEELSVITPKTDLLNLETKNIHPLKDIEDSEKLTLMPERNLIAAEKPIESFSENRRKPKRKSKVSKKLVNQANNLFQDFTLVIKSKRKSRADFIFNINDANGFDEDFDDYIVENKVTNPDIVTEKDIVENKVTNPDIVTEKDIVENSQKDDDTDLDPIDTFGESFDMVDMELDEITTNNTIIEREIPIEPISIISSISETRIFENGIDFDNKLANTYDVNEEASLMHKSLKIMSDDKSLLAEDHEKHKASIVAEAIKKSNMSLNLDIQDSLSPVEGETQISNSQYSDTSIKYINQLDSPNNKTIELTPTIPITTLKETDKENDSTEQNESESVMTENVACESAESHRPKFDFNKYYLEKISQQKQNHKGRRKNKTKSYDLLMEKQKYSESSDIDNTTLHFNEEKAISYEANKEPSKGKKENIKKTTSTPDIDKTENKTTDIYTFDEEFDELLLEPLKQSVSLPEKCEELSFAKTLKTTCNKDDIALVSPYVDEKLDSQTKNGSHKSNHDLKYTAVEEVLDDVIAEFSKENESTKEETVKISELNESELSIDESDGLIKRKQKPFKLTEPILKISDIGTIQSIQPELKTPVAEVKIKKKTRRVKAKNIDLLDEKLLFDGDSSTGDNIEVRRSRRCSKKVTSYNENELLGPLSADLELHNKKPRKNDKSPDNKLIDITENITLEPAEIKLLTGKNKSEAEKKLNTDELFDMLKATEKDNTQKTKPQNSFLENLDETSEEFNDDKFDNVFENILEKSMAVLQNQESVNAQKIDIDKIYEFSESPESILKEDILDKRSKKNNKSGRLSKNSSSSEPIEHIFKIHSANIENMYSVPTTPDIRETSMDRNKPAVENISSSSMDKDPNTNKSASRAGKSKVDKVQDSDEKPNYCEICNKSFIRIENLTKHKRTLTHISKLSEIEAKEAEEKAKAEQNEENIKISVAVEEESSEHNTSDTLSNEDTKNISSFSNHRSLELADIINDVINEPVIENQPENHFSDINLQNSSDIQPEYRRYKSLGERKSFDSENPLNSTDSQSVKSPYYEPPLSKTTILEKQISLLQNIIENQTGMSYIDDISMSSNNSVIDTTSVRVSPSDMSIKDDSSNITFTNNASLTNKTNANDDSFLKPTQYEEISEDSTNVRNYDDQKLRKTLNRDEELFLECCSLLKSGSEVSNYSKKSNKASNSLNRMDMKQVDEPNWLESKSLSENQNYNVEYSDNSRIPTPLGDNFADDASNSNTISSNWNVNVDRKEAMFEDISQDKDADKSFTFEEVLQNVEKAQEKSKSGLSRFGGMLSKTIKNQINNITNKIRKPTEMSNSSERKKSDELSDCSTSDSKKVMTKGAMKVFEGLKVSIPTEELNLEEVLNCSPHGKKLESAKPEEKESITVEEITSPTKRNVRKSKPVKNKSQLGSKLLFKMNKKKTVDKKRKSSSESKTHDVYDFEDTQDNSDIFTKPDYRTFKTKHGEEVSKESDNDSGDNVDAIELDANSASSISSLSNSNQHIKKQPKAQQNMTKKKCMIMGRIFKNAVKSKMEEEFREIPTIDNTEFVENYVKEIKNVKMSENEINTVLDQVLEEKETELQVQTSAVKLKGMDGRRKSFKQKNRKRVRANSDSTDDEFSLNKTTKKRAYKKNPKPEDNCINLEQELKECIGVASRKSQRKCTSGKQNVLVEYWSSDDSAFEALLESQIIEDKPHKEEHVVPKETVEIPDPVVTEVEKSVEVPNEMPAPKTTEKKVQKKAKPHNQKPKNHKTEGPVSTTNRRKRAAANPLYHWSSSSEDESNDLIEVKPIRDETDDEERPVVQHGWIVGNSPKKLVTLLAHAKGKKTDIDCVKEQKKRTNSVS